MAATYLLSFTLIWHMHMILLLKNNIMKKKKLEDSTQGLRKDSRDYTDNYWKDNFEDEDDVEDFLTRDWDD